MCLLAIVILFQVKCVCACTFASMATAVRPVHVRVKALKVMRGRGSAQRTHAPAGHRSGRFSPFSGVPWRGLVLRPGGRRGGVEQGLTYQSPGVIGVGGAAAVLRGRVELVWRERERQRGRGGAGRVQVHLFGRADGHLVRVFLRKRLLTQSQHAQRHGEAKTEETPLPWWATKSKTSRKGIKVFTVILKAPPLLLPSTSCTFPP